jgi:hypothetical protein
MCSRGVQEMKRAFILISALAAISLLLALPHTANAQGECNCVTYARSQVRPLPSGMTSYDEKRAKINHRFPTVGSVAIMPAPGGNAPYGHVSVVRNVEVLSDGSLRLSVEEANWRISDKEPCVSTRTITPQERNIQGYFDPKYPSGEASPRLDSVSPANGSAGKQFYITVTGDGFDAASARGMIYGGWCDSFGKCAIPTNVIKNPSRTSLQIPITIGAPGKYTLYIFNSASGKTSNGKPLTIN